MEKTQEISTCIVRAANNSSTKIHLTPWDLQLLLVDPIQKGLLYRKSQPQENINSFLDHLKTSLSRTLNFFPHLCGRLAIINHQDNNTQSILIDCNNSGAQFTHAIARGIIVTDILESTYVPDIVRSFFPLNGTINIEGTSNPLLAVQVTELKDGYFIGCTFNHAVGDGTSFWHFFNSWCEISRGSNAPSRFPTLKRWSPDDVDFPIQIPLLHENESQKFTPLPWEERVFHFSKENIAKLKRNINLNKTGISSLQAVLAHIWLAVARCRITDNEISLKLVAGARQRLCPPLEEGYFGNALHIVAVTTNPSQLVGLGLGWAAWKLNETVANQTHAEIKDFYEKWLKCPNIFKKGTLLSNSLAVGSSPRFDVYGNDFGWGYPVAVRSGLANKADGKLTVFPGPDPGSMDIEICLAKGSLHDVEKDGEFMAFVSVY